MFHSILADVALVLHALFLGYLVVGGFLAWRWPRTIVSHLAVAIWGGGSILLGYGCPLTDLENWARRSAGEDELRPGGFIDHYLTGVVYPAEHLVAAQSLAFLIVGISWAGLAWRVRARRSELGPAADRAGKYVPGMVSSSQDEHPGVIPSPNIWTWPDVYELENQGVDPDRVIEQAMRGVRDWAGAHVLDVGCGTGFHLPRFAQDASRVTGVEPHPPLVDRASARIAALAGPERERIRVLAGSAEALPLPDASVDVVHARWAYFFGPGCEPGLAELRRVIRRGGTAFVVDNDATRSTFGSWFRRALPSYDPAAVRRFWRRQGFTRVPLDIRWDFPDRQTFARVVKIEFSAAMADAILSEHPGTTVDYAVDLWWRRY